MKPLHTYAKGNPVKWAACDGHPNTDGVKVVSCSCRNTHRFRLNKSNSGNRNQVTKSLFRYRKGQGRQNLKKLREYELD